MFGLVIELSEGHQLQVQPEPHNNIEGLISIWANDEKDVKNSQGN